MSGRFEHTQKEQFRQMNPRQLRFLTGLVGMGLMHGAADNDAANYYRDAQEVLAELTERGDRSEPPRPPRRPNARIGGFVVGNT